MDTMNQIIEYVPEGLHPLAIKNIEEEQAEMVSDIEEARQTYKYLLGKGKEGLDTAFNVVKDSEHPRAIEVFSGLISNLANINGKLVELQKAKKELREPVQKNDTQAGNKAVTQNNLFFGSPKDLLDMLNGEVK
jgi:hypothetical protein